MRFDANEDEDKTGGGFDLIPAGKHRVTVTDHENSKTSGGYEQLVVTYTDDQGRTRNDWLICDGAARWQLSSLVHCMHAEGGATGCPTIFPAPPALGAAFNTTLMTLVGVAISDEVRAMNNAYGSRNYADRPVDLNCRRLI